MSGFTGLLVFLVGVGLGFWLGQYYWCKRCR